MTKAYEEIKRLIATNAKHRKGWHLNDISMKDITTHLKEEAQELHEEPHELHELADVMNNAMHVAIRNGWTLEQIEEAMLYKLSKRFNVE